MPTYSGGLGVLDGSIRSLLGEKSPGIVDVVVPRRRCVVGHTLSEGSALLALAFIILAHRLLAQPSLPGTQPQAQCQPQQPQEAASYDDLPQPRPAVAEQCQASGCPDEE